MIKAILFDFDDTLGDREKAAYNLYRDMLKPYFSDDLLFEAALQDTMIFDQHSNCDKNYIQSQLENRYNIRLNFSIKEDWDKYIGSYSMPYDDTVKTLEYLKRKYRLGVITNGFIETQKCKIETSGLTSYFELVLSSEEAGVKKPDPKIFYEAARRMDLKTNECVYVGDTFSNDIYGALSVGMDAVWMWKHGERQCLYDIKRIMTLSDLKDLF